MVAPVAPAVAQPAAPIPQAAQPVQVQPVAVQPAQPIIDQSANQQPAQRNQEPANNEPAAPEKPKTPKPYVKKVMGEVIDHPMMNFDEPENVAVQKPVATLPPLPPMKAAMTENKEYRADVTWPTVGELQVPETFKQENEQFYKQELFGNIFVILECIGFNWQNRTLAVSQRFNM